MVHDQTERINRAVMECLKQCYSAQNSLDAMSSYLGELRARGDFSDRDIGNIRAAVSDMLRQLASVDNLSHPEDA
jgi:hypothetical protein